MSGERDEATSRGPSLFTQIPIRICAAIEISDANGRLLGSQIINLTY